MKLYELFEQEEQQFFTDPDKIKAWLKNANFTNWQTLSIDADGTVNCNRNVTLCTGKSKQLRVKFGKVAGNFTISEECHIISLSGCPSIVGGNFTMQQAEYLVSLKGCPRKVGKDFNLPDCWAITSLTDGPEEVGKNYKVTGAALKNLDGLPKRIPGNLCLYGNRITNFVGNMHAEVGGSIDLTGNQITSYDKIQDRFSFSGNSSGEESGCLIVESEQDISLGLFNLAQIKNIERIDGNIAGIKSTIKSQLYTKITDMTKIDKWIKAACMVIDAVNNKTDIFDLQVAMIDANLEEFM